MPRREDLRCRRCNAKLAEIDVRGTAQKFGMNTIYIHCKRCDKINGFPYDPVRYIEKHGPLDDELEAIPA